jgi:hypothetical protein
MNQITIDGSKYVRSDDILEISPAFCRNAKSGREIVKKREIGVTDYIFAREAKTDNGVEWKQTEGKSRRHDKVLLRVEYIHSRPELKDLVSSLDEKTQDGNSEPSSQHICKKRRDSPGVAIGTLKEVISTTGNLLPCIYLFSLGYVKDLRTEMKISSNYPDDAIVCKYGFTRDLSRRAAEHSLNYSKIKGVDLRLLCHSYVDPQYTCKAEGDIRQIMNAFHIHHRYRSEEEIVIVTKDMFPMIHKQYENISKNYMGNVSELVAKIKELEMEIERKDCQLKAVRNNYEFSLEIERKDRQLMEKSYQNEILSERTARIIAEKDLEIAMLKVKIGN